MVATRVRLARQSHAQRHNLRPASELGSMSLRHGVRCRPNGHLVHCGHGPLMLVASLLVASLRTRITTTLASRHDPSPRPWRRAMGAQREQQMSRRHSSVLCPRLRPSVHSSVRPSPRRHEPPICTELPLSPKPLPPPEWLPSQERRSPLHRGAARARLRSPTRLAPAAGSCPATATAAAVQPLGPRACTAA